ncbi:MAG: hypothetical protein QOJ19_2096, partial [Acidimicrobiia bacterium]|nr:hypothetical protein [Acidimicrobiia bacterium]
MTDPATRGRRSLWRASVVTALVGVATATTLSACSGSGSGSARVQTNAEPETIGPSPPTVSTEPTTASSTPMVALTTSPSTAAPSTTVATTAPPSTDQPSTDAPTIEAPASESTAAAVTPSSEPALPAIAPTSGAAGPPNEPFAFEVTTITAGLRARVEPTSWRAGCPVALEELRYLQLSYWGFDDAAHVGELVVAASAVETMRAVFSRLYAQRFPIRQMRLVDDYGGDDFASIEADNTSAFNCR